MDAFSPARRLQEKATEVLATVKFDMKASQRAVDCLVKGTNSMFDIFLEVLQGQVSDQLVMFDGHISLGQIYETILSFKGQSLFEGVGTSTALEQSINFHSAEKPVLLTKKTLEWKAVWQNGIPKMVSWKFGYFVPFLEQLGQLLQCQDVLHCVQNPLPHIPGKIRTITDSAFCRFHPVVLRNPMSPVLVFGVYVDDVEPCDPLKSKSGKHTLRMFYWTLFNIHPDKRSTLKAINLLAIVKKSVAKEFGNEPFLRNFVDGLKELGNQGVVFNIDGKKMLFHGILHSAHGDTPAMGNLGGFKESHFALRPCRLCMAKNFELCESFVEEPALMREKEEHEKFLMEVMSQSNHYEFEENICEENVDDPDDDVDMEDISSKKYTDHENPSVNYGINGPSILSEAPGFDVTKCLALDMMHVMAEGVLEEVCRRILKDACFPPHPTLPKRLAPGRLKLSEVNDAIENLSDFGSMNGDRPSRIEQQHLKAKLRQSAAQMNLLANVLPFLLKENRFFTERKHKLLIDLLKFNNLCMSFELNDNDIKNIGIKSKELGELLKEIYPDINTIKLHSLKHLATQVRLLGPLRQLACYRYEAMHTEFKSVVPVVRTKKDIALTLGKRQILKRNAEIIEGLNTGSFLQKDDSIVGGVATAIQDIMPLSERQVLLESLSECDEASLVIKVKKITRAGITWTEDCFVSLKSSEYGTVKSLYLVDGELFFVIKKLETTFDPHVNASLISTCHSELIAVCCKDLSSPIPIAKFSFVYRRQTRVYLVDMSKGN